jgi:tetratricopeptide (TPR) repeat protein
LAHPQVYFDYLRDRDTRPLKRTLYHNAMDVVTMAALLHHISQMLSDPFSFAVEHGLDWITLGKLYEHLGRLDEAVRLFERSLEHDWAEAVVRETVQRLALVHLRRGDMHAAVVLWRRTAQTRQIYAFVELAKYYGHQVRDYALAA